MVSEDVGGDSRQLTMSVDDGADSYEVSGGVCGYTCIILIT